MKIKCRYCGSMISNMIETCPNCGAINEDCIRGSSYSPKTIEHLLNFCRMRKIPLDKIKIAVDYNTLALFWTGIYKLEDRFIVYKNKTDGSRDILYDGKDEAYAVAFIYEKIKEAITSQKEIEQLRHLSSSLTKEDLQAASEEESKVLKKNYWKTMFQKISISRLLFAILIIFILFQMLLISIISTIFNIFT